MTEEVGDPGQPICRSCNMKFSDNEALTRHRYRTHAMKGPNYHVAKRQPRGQR